MSAVTQGRVLRSEWTKLHSLRSSWLTLVIASGLVVGFGLLIPFLNVTDWDPNAATADFPAVERSLAGIFLAQIAFGVLGALVITGEYTTGMVRATFAAVPRRLPVLWAKLAVFLAVAFVLGIVSCVLAFFGGQAIFATKDVEVSFRDPNVARAVIGAGLFLAGVGAFGVALGALLRNTAAAIGALTGWLFVVPLVVGALPESLSDAIAKYLPGDAGTVIVSVTAEPERLGPWTGMAVLYAYAAVTTAIAAVLLVRRDV